MTDQTTTRSLGRYALIVVAILGLVTASCSSTTGDTASSSTTQAPADVSTTVADDESTTEPVEVSVDETVDSLNAYWSDVAADIGITYVPLDRSQVTDGTDGATCDGVPVAEDPDNEDNASAAGCTEGLLIAYDPAYMEASPLRIQTTLAHEWGHIIQFQNPDLDAAGSGLDLDAELQADCMQGAWSTDNFIGDLDEARQEFDEIGDDESVGIDEADAHGLPEERLAAFDLGFDEGPAACFDDRFQAILPG